MGRYTGSIQAILFPNPTVLVPGMRVRHVRLRRPFGDSVSHTRRCDTPWSAKPRSVAKMGRYTCSIQAVLFPNHTVLVPGMRVRHVRLWHPFGDSVSHTRRCDTPWSAKPIREAKMGRYTGFIQAILCPNHTVLIPEMRVRHVRLSAPLRGLGVAHAQV